MSHAPANEGNPHILNLKQLSTKNFDDGYLSEDCLIHVNQYPCVLDLVIYCVLICHSHSPY